MLQEIKLQDNKLLLKPTPQTYSVGDEAFGGKIAYIYQPGDPGYEEGKTKGFVVSEYINPNHPWGCSGTYLGASGYTLGTGFQNTLTIVNNCSDINTAAYKCYNYSQSGYTDWYLPSLDELYKIYLNRTTIGIESNGFIYSSTEYNSDTAIQVYFSNGNNYTINKDAVLKILAIRNFEVKKEIYFKLVYKIGDDALGGKIAYIYQSGDPGYIEGEQHGLVAQPEDISTTLKQWGCDGTEISGAGGTSLGTGEQNTLDIVNGCSETDRAARLCYESTINGYNDWFLPSKDELNKLYLNKNLIGGFPVSSVNDLYYWSSSEVDSTYVWAQEFNTGSQYNNFFRKWYLLRIRAIRYF